MGVVLITGCRVGFGREAALAFARRGDVVVATLRDPSVDGGLAATATAEGLALTVGALDVTDPTSVNGAVGGVIDAHGRIDVLVNNAGIAGPLVPLEEQDEAAMQLVFDTNVWGPIRLCRAVLPHMRRQTSGVIVNVSSMAARKRGSATSGVYGMTKAAVSRLTESVDAEVRPFGVRCVALEPGYFATEFNRDGTRPALDPASPYAALMTGIERRSAGLVAAAQDPRLVVDAMLRAVDDPTTPVRLLVGADAIDVYRQQLRAEHQAEFGGSS